MKINCKEILKGFDGENVVAFDNNQVKQNVTVGIALSNMMLGNQGGNKVKMIVLAQKFFTEGIIDLDISDFRMVREIVDNSSVYSDILIPGLVLLYLDGLKE